MDETPKHSDIGVGRVGLRALTDDDVATHNAGEDGQTIRWLSGAPSTRQSTRQHFEMLARNARLGSGKRGFGVLLDGVLAGYIDFDPDADDLPEPGDVNIAYTVHPWARRRGVATEAVNLLCARLGGLGVGRRAIIRAATDNYASTAVARRSGFVHLGDFPALGETGPSGEPVIYSTFSRTLADAPD